MHGGSRIPGLKRPGRGSLAVVHLVVGRSLGWRAVVVGDEARRPWRRRLAGGRKGRHVEAAARSREDGGGGEIQGGWRWRRDPERVGRGKKVDSGWDYARGEVDWVFFF